MTQKDILDELTKTLEEIPAGEDGRITFVRPELERHWGMGERTTLKRIKLLVASGVLKPTMVRVATMHGNATVKGYEYTNNKGGTNATTL